jgi:hypothetical protein
MMESKLQMKCEMHDDDSTVGKQISLQIPQVREISKLRRYGEPTKLFNHSDLQLTEDAVTNQKNPTKV